MFRLFTHFFSSLALLSFAVAAPAPPPNPPPVTFDIAATPSWVAAIQANRSATDADEGGISYLLVDRQENVAEQASFYHEVRRVTSENGVQNGASVTATFDPSYQKLIFHNLQILRGNARLNRLVRSEIKLLRREKDMESFLYDGAYTAHCDLEDVRVGDIIEYAYTLRGMNPVKAGRFSRNFSTDWNTRTHRIITRIVSPADRPLHFRTYNRELKPSITSGKGTTIWLSDQTNVPGRRTDSDVPADYDPNGSVQVSEYGSWREIVEWALLLFQLQAPLSQELQSEIEKLRGIGDIEERILAALRLVQDQVRYLGIESGVSSHRPTAPAEVFRRRFGDCKDKALLLTALLQQSGVDAVPALVSTGYRKTVRDRLPAPENFDHAIVQVKNGSDVHWLDPTRSSQRGRLSEIYVRDLGFALVLRPGTDALTAYAPPPNSLPRRKIVENYRVVAPGSGQSGELDVVTENYGLSAERARSLFQESGREKIEKEYQQYYARTFPRVTVRKPLVFEEIGEANACRVIESYSIPEMWDWDQDEEKHRLSLYPGDIAQAMGSAGPSQRDDPLALNYPADVTQEIHAQMFSRWSLDIKNRSVSNAFFRYTDKATVKGSRLDFVYRYEALADRVWPAELPAYNAALTKVRDTLGYTLAYRPDAELPDFSRWLRAVNWPLSFLTGAFFAVCMLLGVLYIVKSRRAIPLLVPQTTLPEYDGLRGWLILVGIHHVVRPIVFLVMVGLLFPKLANLETWRLLTEPGQAQYDPYWKPTLLFEYFFNILCFAISIVLIVLFFLKRAVWPRSYALFLGMLVIGVAIDTYLARKLSVAGVDTSTRALVRVIGAAIVWIPYCFISKRVRATFRR